MKSLSWKVSVVVGILAMALALNPTTPRAETLLVGVSCALSGPAISFGLPGSQSAYLWMEEVNEQGGLKIGSKTYKIDVVAYDHKTNISGATTAINNLVFKNKVKHVMLAGFTPGADAVQPIVTANKVLTFVLSYSPRSADSENTYTWKLMCTPIERYPAKYAWLAKNHPELKTTYVIGPNNAIGETALRGAKLAQPLPSSAIKIVGHMLIDETSDYYPILNKVLPLKPDYIDLTAMSVTSSALITKQARELGYKGQMGSIMSGMDAKAFCDIAGVENAEGFLSISLTAGQYCSSDYTAFVNKYTKRYANWNDFAGECYMAWQVMGKVLQRAASTDPDEIIKQLGAGAKFETVLGPVYFDNLGGYYPRACQAVYPVPIAKIRNGKSETVALVKPILP
jgi:branched-chain amino acid transport system substrate-binding protein